MPLPIAIILAAASAAARGGAVVAGRAAATAGRTTGRTVGKSKPKPVPKTKLSQRSATQTSRARLKTTAKKTPNKPKTLYHGTATKADLPKGTQLSRGSGATTNYKFAESYAKGRAKEIPSLAGRPRVLTVKNSKTSRHAKNRDGTVKWKGPKNEYNDPKGFVVKGEAKNPKVSKPKMKPVKKSSIKYGKR